MSIVTDGPVQNGPSQDAQLSEASTIFLLAPPMSAGADKACAGLVAGGQGHETVLSINFNTTADDRLRCWEACAGCTTPERVGLIRVDEAGPRADGGYADRSGAELSIATVASPGNLTQIGVAVSEHLDAWEDHDGGIGVCFHSLTTLLQYADLDCVYRFLHVLSRELRAVDAVAHYHLDPGAHDEATVNTLLSLADAVVRVDGDEWDVSVRN